MRTRLRYMVLNNVILSSPIVIGTKTYCVQIYENVVTITNLDKRTEMLFTSRKPYKSINAAKKAAKAKLIENGATFSDEIRNRTLTKKK